MHMIQLPNHIGLYITISIIIIMLEIINNDQSFPPFPRNEVIGASRDAIFPDISGTPDFHKSKLSKENL